MPNVAHEATIKGMVLMNKKSENAPELFSGQIAGFKSGSS